MSDGLKNKTLHGLFWSFFERMGAQGLQFMISIILARLLMPEEFGLIVMLMVFIDVAMSFVDSGFGSALVQKKNVTHIDECSIFYFNILLGILMAGCLCLIAPWIADFYEKPILIPLTRVLSLSIVIGAFGTVQETLLIKGIDFKTQTKVSMIATIFSGSIGIVMAYHHFGVWSLVAQSLSNIFFSTSLLWMLLRWRPTLIFSFRSLRTMFPFGSKLLFSSLLNTVFNNIYVLVIGKLFSATDMGFYSRANGLQRFPSNSISGTLNRVTFPIFSSIQDDKARLKKALRKALTMISMLNFPMMIGLSVVAKPLVLVLLTDKWLPCVPYLQLLCAVGILQPLHAINLNILKAQGRSDLFLKLEIIKKIMIIIAIAITYRWGISAMICGQIATSCMGYYLNTYYTGKLLDYPIIEQIRDILPSLILASIMGAGVCGLHYVPFPNQAALLGTQVLIGGILFASLCRLFKVSSFMEIMGLIKTTISQ